MSSSALHFSFHNCLFSPDRLSPLAHFPDKELRLLPRSEMAAFVRLIPVHNILVISLAPLPWSIAIIATEPTYANRNIDPPSSRIDFALPIEPRGGRSGVGQPVQHDRVEHLVFAEYFLDVAVVMGPVFELLVDPGSLADWGVGKSVAESLWPGFLLMLVASMAFVPNAIVVRGSFYALPIMAWELCFFLQVDQSAHACGCTSIVVLYLRLEVDGVHMYSLQTFGRLVA